MTRHIPEEKINEVINTVNIADIVADYVTLKKAGKNLVGLCPFHTEKTPSFTVSSEKQIFYCFGCGQGGDVLSFYMKQEGYSFPEAVKSLAERHGINIPERDLSLSEKKALTEKEELYAINERALNFFCHQFSKKDAGLQVRNYIDQRGISEKMVKKFQIGYAPNGWDHLIRSLAKNKIDLPLIEKAGLIIPKKQGKGYYDRFRDRLIFPIFDAYKKVIGFGGRTLDNTLPKYLNSPETPLFHKGHSLYGLDTARRECRLTRSCYIVEGYFDVISLHMYGIKNTVATLGTALTPHHIRIIQGLIGKTGKIILVFDSDTAGIKAAERTITLFKDSFSNTKVLILPPNHDPDSFVQKNGADAFHTASDNAKGIISFLLDMAIKRHGLSVEGKIKVIESLQSPLISMSDAFRRSLYIQKISERLNIPETIIIKKIDDKFKHQRNETEQNQTSYDVYSVHSKKHPMKPPSIRNKEPLGNRLERQVIAMMLQNTDIITEVQKRHLVDKISNGVLKAIGQLIMEHLHGKETVLSDIINKTDDIEQKNLLASLMIQDEIWDDMACQKIITQFETSFIRRNQNLINKIKEAEASDDMELLQRLLMEKQNQAIKKTKLNWSSQEAKPYGENI